MGLNDIIVFAPKYLKRAFVKGNFSLEKLPLITWQERRKKLHRRFWKRRPLQSLIVPNVGCYHPDKLQFILSFLYNSPI